MKLKIYMNAWYFIHLISSVHSSRILGIFPMEGKSHFNFHEAIIKSLLSVGHRITLIAPFEPENFHENLTVINSQTIQNTQLEPMSKAADVNLSWFASIMLFMDYMEHYCNQILPIHHAKDLKNFDVIFLEALPLHRCFLPIAEKLKIPVIATISCRSLIDSDFSVGLSRSPSVFPNDDESFPRHRSPKMTFYEKVTNLLQEMQIRVFNILGERRADRLIEKYFPETGEGKVKVSLLLANDHEIFLPRAKPPNFINIGGIYVKSSLLKPLPQDLKQFIEEARHGVILFSFGSVASDDEMEPYLKSILKSVFAKIPQRVIWKTSEQIEDLPKNIILSKWVPQKEVLAHKNVLAFISHAGQSSTYESIYFGKPMICIPLFGDQPNTAAFLSSLEVGLYMEFSEIDEPKLLDAINKIINDTKYRENMEDLSLKFRNDLKSPEELVIYWTEYVVRHKGGLHLRTTDADIPLYQFLLLDMIIFTLCIALISGYSFFMFMKFIKKKFSFSWH